MKHEKFDVVQDQIPAPAVRGIAVCLVLGLCFWGSVWVALT